MMSFLSELAENEIKLSVNEAISEAVQELKHELQPLYLKKYQVCELLNISNQTLDGLIRLGLPSIKVNGITRYNRDEVIKWVNKYKR